MGADSGDGGKCGRRAKVSGEGGGSRWRGEGKGRVWKEGESVRRGLLRETVDAGGVEKGSERPSIWSVGGKL